MNIQRRKLTEADITIKRSQMVKCVLKNPLHWVNDLIFICHNDIGSFSLKNCRSQHNDVNSIMTYFMIYEYSQIVHIPR